MNKVGILTLHFSLNYGAVLQCYALRKTIADKTGYDVDVINYIPPSHGGRSFKETHFSADYEKKLRLFDNFRSDECGISPQKVTKENLREDQGEYDFYVAGSDQIWNTSFSLFDPLYFLDFAEAPSKKIAYAASIGLSLDDPLLDKSVFKAYVPKLDHISVREQTHQAFVQRYTDKTEVETVLDPTMLLKKEDYDNILAGEKEKCEKFIFLYFLKHDTSAVQALNFANTLSRKFDLPVVHNFTELPGAVFKHASKSMAFEGPKDFLWYIKNAEAVVTNSFHGTVFSLLFKTPFYTILDKKMASRAADLLRNCNLSDRIVKGFVKADDVNMEVDFRSADRYISKQKEKSIKFLMNALTT
ncbi:polysaccharide pyruvyl transferase family protein [Oscillospiraceae bacterium OttesenSCG-928-F05]|nr:polysaccharide pyruvyl transferase family protein [Oscillospiraceae bacterium OttesenSCG-928-F05]